MFRPYIRSVSRAQADFDGLPDRCPPDPSHLADLYSLGRLSPEEKALFEAHYIICAACADQVTLAEEFITSLKGTGL